MADLLDDGVSVDDYAGQTPWHFWAIAAVALLWNSVPTFDSTLTLLRVESWTGNGDAGTLAKVYSAPIWANIAWLVGGWGGFIGAILLLIRSRYATYGFIASLLGAAISFSWQFSAGLQASPILPAIIIASEVFFWWYATKMRDAGVLT